MSTKLVDDGDHVVVSTVSSLHGSKRMARGAVRVLKSDEAAVKAEIVRQAEVLRALAGVPVQQPAPVV